MNWQHMDYVQREGVHPTVMPHDNQPEPMHNATIQDLKSSVRVHDHPGAYGTLGEMPAPLSAAT